MTPEAKVKAKVHKLLKQADAYAVNYIGGVYAKNGTPDILACAQGRFVGIEVKAGKNRPTTLQLRALQEIDEAGGLALVVNESELDYLAECLRGIAQAKSNYQKFQPKEKDDAETVCT